MNRITSKSSRVLSLLLTMVLVIGGVVATMTTMTMNTSSASAYIRRGVNETLSPWEGIDAKVRSAIEKAVPTTPAGKTAVGTVSILGANDITKETLQDIATVAKDAGGKCIISVMSEVGGLYGYEFLIDTSKITSKTQDINLQLFLTSSAATSVKDKMSAKLGQDVGVLRFGQKEEFGMEIGFRFDPRILGGIGATEPTFYEYEGGAYSEVEVENSLTKDNYRTIYISNGGNLVLTD